MINYEESGDITTHLPVLYTITRALKPKVILEIGIRKGVSTKAFAMAIHEGGFNCEHHCCDIDPKCIRVIERYNGIPYIMDSEKLAEQWDKEIDILFIDGCHEYGHVKKDYLNFRDFVRKDGIIFFHDTFPGKWKDNPERCYTVYKILDDIEEEHVTLPYQNGLTICRK